MVKNKFIKGFLEGFKKFSHRITNIINFILLFVVYFIGVGLTSIVAKISKKHFLDLKKEDTNSYWKEINLKKESVENYLRQF